MKPSSEYARLSDTLIRWRREVNLTELVVLGLLCEFGKEGITTKDAKRLTGFVNRAWSTAALRCELKGLATSTSHQAGAVRHNRWYPTDKTYEFMEIKPTR